MHVHSSPHMHRGAFHPTERCAQHVVRAQWSAPLAVLQDVAYGHISMTMTLTGALDPCHSLCCVGSMEVATRSPLVIHRSCFHGALLKGQSCSLIAVVWHQGSCRFATLSFSQRLYRVLNQRSGCTVSPAQCHGPGQVLQLADMAQSNAKG